MTQPCLVSLFHCLFPTLCAASSVQVDINALAVEMQVTQTCSRTLLSSLTDYHRASFPWLEPVEEL